MGQLQQSKAKPIQIDMSVDDVQLYIKQVAIDLGKSRGNRMHGNSSRAMLKLLGGAERKLTDNYGVKRSEKT